MAVKLIIQGKIVNDVQNPNELKQRTGPDGSTFETLNVVIYCKGRLGNKNPLYKFWLSATGGTAKFIHQYFKKDDAIMCEVAPDVEQNEDHYQFGSPKIWPGQVDGNKVPRASYQGRIVAVDFVWGNTGKSDSSQQSQTSTDTDWGDAWDGGDTTIEQQPTQQTTQQTNTEQQQAEQAPQQVNTEQTAVDSAREAPDTSDIPW